MKRTCERARLVEAMFDARLGPSESESTERHLKTCTKCSELLCALNLLRDTLRETASVVSPLEHQRARLALLRRGAEPPAASRRTVVVAVVLGCIMLPLAAWASARAMSANTALPPRGVSRPLEPTARAAPTVVAIPIASSSHVQVVTTPPSIRPRAAEAPRARQTPAASAPSNAATTARLHSTRQQASLDFADAMQALSNGDFGASARRFQHFTAVYASDARAEDAAYLSAIALERAGRVSDARAAAERYLIAFPGGVHRAHAQTIAGKP